MKARPAWCELAPAPMERGRFTVRIAGTAAELAEAQALRHWCFHGRAGLDRDRFDAVCKHVLIRDMQNGDLVCCYRVLPVDCDAGLAECYSARVYDLAPLSALGGRGLELGRFCIRPGEPDPDILRLAWAMLTRLVDTAEIDLLFGCASFPGTAPQNNLPVLRDLAERHLAEGNLRPGRRAPEIFAFAHLAGDPAVGPSDPRDMPALLRTYLGMGGKVSDHAVIDREMNTFHVFTAVEIAAIPPARARALRMLADG